MCSKFKAIKMKAATLVNVARTGVDDIDSKRGGETYAYTVQPGGY